MLKLNTLLLSFCIFFPLNAQSNKFRILEENYYSGNLTYFTFKTTYKYDSKGNRIEKNDYNLDSKWTYKYDSKGNEIEWNYYYSGSLESKYTSKYEHDSKGNWVKKTQFEIRNEIEIPINITERVLEYY